jgi:16S rRNA (guanine527-N7)-methyltransferase
MAAERAVTGATADRLAELARRYGLDDAAVRALAALLAQLAEDATAPTTVREPEAAVDAHIADALVGLEREELRMAGRIADLGAGAGFPGLVLAAALPHTRVDLVESVGRKCAYMERAAARAGLANAHVVHARAETWADGCGACDAVTVRAVAPLAVLVEYAAPLLRRGGALAAWKGRRDPEEEEHGRAAAAIVGMEPREVVRVEPFPAAEHRHLHVYVKVADTPPRFPRRPGMARKRPLAGPAAA